MIRRANRVEQAAQRLVQIEIADHHHARQQQAGAGTIGIGANKRLGNRARRPLVEGRVKDMESNAFWATWLPLVLRDPRVRGQVLDTGAGLAAVKAEDVQALFARLAADKAPVTIVARAK